MNQCLSVILPPVRKHFALATAVSILVCITVVPFYPFLLPQASLRKEGAAVPAQPAPRKDARVLLFVLDGVGARIAFDADRMPLLGTRLRFSARGIAEATFPTITPAGLRAIIAGRRGTPEPEFPGGPAADEPGSVLRRASVAGLPAVVVGQQNWGQMFGEHGAFIETIPYLGGSGGDYDAATFAAASRLMSAKPWNLFVVHFFGADPIAHRYGTEGPKYHARIREIDAFVASLARRAGPRTTVVVTADHGQMPGGEHGGNSRYEVEAPLVMWGPGIRPGPIKKAALRDIAPTVAVLLGVPPPVMSEREPLYEALALSDTSRAEAALLTLAQKDARSRELRGSWPWLQDKPAVALEKARRLLRSGHERQAWQTAEAACLEADKAVSAASPQGWYGRFLVCEGLLIFAGVLMLMGPAPDPPPKGQEFALGVMLALMVPLLVPWLWPWASLACLSAAGGLFAAAAWSRAGLLRVSRADWLALCWGALILGFPALIDVYLWAWAALVLVIAYRWRAGLSWLPAAACLAFAWAMGPARGSSGGSLLRMVLAVPDQPARWVSRLPVGSFLLLAAVVFWPSLPRTWSLRRRLGLVVGAIGPLLFAVTTMTWFPVPRVYPVLWAILATAAGAWLTVRVPRSSRWLWLGLLTLAFHRALVLRGPGSRLIVGLVLSRFLAKDARRSSPVWRALQLVGVVLWSYLSAGYSLDFSQISVSVPYASFGHSWHPWGLVAVVALRQAAAIGGPAIPLLAELDLETLVAMMPMLGTWSLGNLAIFWVDTMWAQRGLLDVARDEFIARAIWATVIVWVLLTWRAIIALGVAGRRAVTRSEPVEPLAA